MNEWMNERGGGDLMVFPKKRRGHNWRGSQKGGKERKKKKEERVIGQWGEKDRDRESGSLSFWSIGSASFGNAKVGHALWKCSNSNSSSRHEEQHTQHHSFKYHHHFSLLILHSLLLFLPFTLSFASWLVSSISTTPPRTMKRRRLAPPPPPPSALNSGTLARVQWFHCPRKGALSCTSLRDTWSNTSTIFRSLPLPTSLPMSSVASSMSIFMSVVFSFHPTIPKCCLCFFCSSSCCCVLGSLP